MSKARARAEFACKTAGDVYRGCHATVSKTVSTFGIRALGPSETVASSWGKLAHDSGTLKG